MRSFERHFSASGQVHDGVVMDDVRDLQFLVEHQEKLQGKYNRLAGFGNTPGGTCAYSQDLFRMPVVVTVNNSTRNLDYLVSDDFCSKRGNVHFLGFSGKPGEAPPQTSWPLRADSEEVLTFV